MRNGTEDLNLMMFAGKEVRLLTILYKKHSLAILRSALRVVRPVESSNWRAADGGTIIEVRLHISFVQP